MTLTIDDATSSAPSAPRATRVVAAVVAKAAGLTVAAHVEMTSISSRSGGEIHIDTNTIFEELFWTQDRLRGRFLKFALKAFL